MDMTILILLCWTFMTKSVKGSPDPLDDRIEDIISRLQIHDKIQLLGSTTEEIKDPFIPSYTWWSEGLHGIGFSPGVSFSEPYTCNATSFPQVITVAQSFDASLFYDVGAAIGTEGRAFHNYNASGLTFWAPNVNILRDPRWGRAQETPGEDPTLSSIYAINFVQGMQEGEDYPKYLKVSACCKHFAAYSLENLHNGTSRHSFDAHVSPQDFADTYSPVFEACVKGGKATCIMCSYNSVNGIPSCVNSELMNGLVRGRWGFDGYITSDCGALRDVSISHGYTKSPEETCRAALQAGVDLDCSGDVYVKHMSCAIEQGLVTEEEIDVALRHLFRVQFRLGLFDPLDEQSYSRYDYHRINSPQHQQLALQAAQEGIVLLKNVDETLPLFFPSSNLLSFATPERRRRRLTSDPASLAVAVIGPLANATQALLGNYFGIPPFIVSPWEGIRRHYAPAAAYALGCGINASYPARLAEAEDLARQSDVVILVLGLDISIETEWKDRRDLYLPMPQVELAHAVLQASEGRPIVVVLVAGGAVDISFLVDDARVQAILFAGYPGQSGGDAIAQIIFGDVNPSGRISQTFYFNNFTSQVQMADMRLRATGTYPGRTYRFFQGPVLFDFGHGLSYSTFAPRFLSACPTQVARVFHARSLAQSSEVESSTVTRICVSVLNEGPYPGRFVLLVFLSPPPQNNTSSSNPTLSLRGFTSLVLSPRETSVVEISFSEEDFSLADEQGIWTKVPGAWKVILGDVHGPSQSIHVE